VRANCFILFSLIAFLSSLDLNAQSLSKKQIDSMLDITNVGWDLERNIKNLKQIYGYAEKINYEKGKYRALMHMSNWYMLKRQYKTAIPIFENVESLPIENPDNYIYKIQALQDKASAYIELGFFDDAHTAINKSLNESRNLKNDNKFLIIGRAYHLKATLCIELKKPEDSVLFYTKKSILYFQKIQKTYLREGNLQSAYINISTSFFEAKKLDSALFYSYKVKSMKNLGLEAKSYLFQTIAQVHIEKNRVDSALFYYKKSEAISRILEDPATLKIAYTTLSGLYEKLGYKDSSLIYSKKYSRLVDSIALLDKKAATIASQAIKKEVQEENTETKQRLYIILLCIFVLLCVLIIFLWFFFKNYHKEKKERMKKDEILLEKDDELIKTKSIINSAFEEVTKLAKNNDPAFLGRFKEVYPAFCNEILKICPDMINSELEFCAYLKLNFSTKDIATYTFVTPKAVQNRKNRIRKKLNIPSDEDIYFWMNKVEKK